MDNDLIEGDAPEPPKPIFFAVTRSFLLGLLPALLTLVDLLFAAMASSDGAAPVAAIIAAVLNTAGALPFMGFLETTADQVHAVMTALAPVYALIVGQQRMHAARPYTIDPRALT